MLVSKIKQSLFTSLFLLFPLFLGAQNSTEIEIFGKVIEKESAQAVPYATVVVTDATSKKVITGSTTDENGQFSLKVNATSISVEISFVGYEKKNIENVSIENGKADLGTVILVQDSKKLDEVVIEGEKFTTEFKLDKRVFNVGKELSSTGASALEVLNNIPSVTVDIEGEIKLRGSSGVQILINGKPSVIASEQGGALGTITANMIEKVEVITNPSAKYDAEGTSGIINVIIKKEERKGINGSASINLGAPHNHSFGLSLNKRTEKFNLFSQLGAGYREIPRFRKNINTNLVKNTSVYSDGTEYRNEQFYNFVLGTDYHINETNVLTLSGRAALEIEDQPSHTNFKQTDSTGAFVSESYRTEETEAINPKYQYELQYKSDFKDHEDHVLLVSALGNFFGKEQSSDFQNITKSGVNNDGKQQTETNFKESKNTFKLDYTKPFSEKLVVETGAQYLLQEVSNDYAVSDLIAGKWVQDAGLTNTFEYKTNVLGVYGTGAYENGKLGVKLGLRMENTLLETLLLTTNQKNSQNFTNLFPTVHTSYNVSEKLSLQLGYSKRISRPRLWNLNPFFNIRNTFSIRTGNPELLPEFTDSYEFSSIYTIKKASMNLTFYQRFTTDVVDYISLFEDNVTTVKPFNIGTNSAFGAEYNIKYSPHRKVTILGDINYNIFNRKGELEGESFDFSADTWTTRWTTQLNLPKKFNFEITGNYESETETIQGRTSERLFANMGVRKKIGKGKVVINFSIRDIFNSRIWESETNQPNFYVYSHGSRGRFMSLGVSYAFGKGEAMQFTGSRRR